MDDNKLFYIAQIVGAIGLVVTLIAFQTNKRSSLIKLQTTSIIVYALHFMLLGAFTGMALSLITALRNYAYRFSDKQRVSIRWPILFACIFTLATFLTWEGWISLLLLIASLTGVYSYWQTNPKVIRWLELTTLFWIVYNIQVRSLTGVIYEGLIVSSVILGIYRFDIRAQDNDSKIRSGAKT
jgi:hypothetical protein